MKNAITYYYNLIFDDIHQTNKMYYFDYDNLRYFFVKYEGDPAILNDIYNLHLNLLRNGFYVHEIVLNKDSQIVSFIEGYPYILMKAIYYKDRINYDMVSSFLRTATQLDSNLERFNWGELWSLKNDNLEYQISQLGQKHLSLRDSFSYYIGLGETGIQLVNSLAINDILKVVAHRRIEAGATTFDLYNPLNLIIDSRVRDMAEYFKASFFNGKDIADELNYFLMNSNLSRTEHLLFLGRMIYPTYYFDLFEDIIKGDKSDDEMKKITNLTSDYELFLKKLYRYYRYNFNIEPIEWLDRY